MTWHRSFECRLPLILILLSALPAGAAASLPRLAVVQQDVAPAASSLPLSKPQQATPQTPSAGGLPATTSQQSGQLPTPLGTAVAPDTHIDGVAASTPSGAAIAPAKQRRIRRFSVRTALVVGAVVAVGITAGATAATSGRP